jgi:hypothetical protein
MLMSDDASVRFLYTSERQWTAVTANIRVKGETAVVARAARTLSSVSSIDAENVLIQISMHSVSKIGRSPPLNCHPEHRDRLPSRGDEAA